MHCASHAGIFSPSGCHIVVPEAWGTGTHDGTLAITVAPSNNLSFVSDPGVLGPLSTSIRRWEAKG